MSNVLDMTDHLAEGIQELLAKAGTLDVFEAAGLAAESANAVRRVRECEAGLRLAMNTRDGYIRLLSNEGGISYRDLADVFDLSHQRIAQIKQGKEQAPAEEFR